MSQASKPATGSPVTLINVFDVPAEHVEAFIAAWRERAALMSTKPGFLDTRLHRALSPQTRFQLVNIAHWETPRPCTLPPQIRSSSGASAPRSLTGRCRFRRIRPCTRSPSSSPAR
jgi:hypothetical protein